MIRPLSRLALLRILVPVVGDLTILFAALATSFAFRQPQLLRADVFLHFGPLFAVWLGAFYALGLYDLRLVRDFVTLVGSLLGAGVSCLATGAIYFYLLSPYYELTPKTHLVLSVALSMPAMLGWRRAILSLTDYSLMRLRLLLLAAPEHVEHLSKALFARSGEGLDIAGRLEDDVDLVVADVAWIENDWPRSKAIFSAAVGRSVPIVSLESFYESLFGKVSPQYAADPGWALEHILPRVDGAYFKTRRAFETVASALGLLALMPLLALTALMIRLLDHVSPLYGQERVGYLGKRFILWKFRTMKDGADGAGPFVHSDEERDARITRLGAVLRRFRIDEFPQLWNVLRGEMSLVGPRPEWLKEVEIIEKVVPNYHLRHLVPPGITGWAQVYYRATNDPQESVEKHHYDLYYLKHFSAALDLSILLKTVKRVFVKDSRMTSTITPFPRLRKSAALLDIASIITRD